MPNKNKPIIHNKFLKANLAFLKTCEKKNKKREAEAAAHEANMAEFDKQTKEIREEISFGLGVLSVEPEKKKTKIREGKPALEDDTGGDLDSEEDEKIKQEVEKEMKLMEEAKDDQHIKQAINNLTREKHGGAEVESLRAEIHKESKKIAIKFFAAKYKGEDNESKLAQFKKALRKIDLSNIQESTGLISVAMDDLSSGIDRNHEYLKELTKYYKVGADKYLTDKHGEEYTKEFMEKVKDMAHKRKMRNVDVRPQQVAAASRVMDLTACDDVRPESQPQQQVAAASRVMDLTACDDGN
jgi:hypothetical protein